MPRLVQVCILEGQNRCFESRSEFRHQPLAVPCLKTRHEMSDRWLRISLKHLQSILEGHFEGVHPARSVLISDVSDMAHVKGHIGALGD